LSGSAEPLEQPGAEVTPLPVQGPLRQAEHLRRLGRRQPTEVTQQHDPGFQRILFFQLLEGLLDWHG
jgi:hypothetical protein